MKKFLTSETAWKIYSVLIAVMLWGFVVVNQNPDSSKTVGGIDVFCTNIDALEQEGLTILQDENLHAEIKVSGKRLSIAKVDKTNISASVTVPEIKAGSYEVPIDVKLPISDVTISDKKPYKTMVVVEELAKKSFPIEVVINGAGAEERAQLKAVLSADKVELSGPKSVIESAEHVRITVNKGDAGKNSIRADLQILNKQNEDITENINVHKSFSSVSVKLVKMTTAHTTVEGVTEGEPAYGYEVKKVTCNPETVVLGTQAKKNDWEASVKTVPISIEGKTESFIETVELVVPEGYELMDEQVTVKVRVEIGPITAED